MSYQMSRGKVSRKLHITPIKVPSNVPPPHIKYLASHPLSDPPPTATFDDILIAWFFTPEYSSTDNHFL